MSGRAGSRFVVSAVLGAMALAIYPTIIHPILMEDEYGEFSTAGSTHSDFLLSHRDAKGFADTLLTHVHKPNAHSHGSCRCSQNAREAAERAGVDEGGDPATFTPCVVRSFCAQEAPIAALTNITQREGIVSTAVARCRLKWLANSEGPIFV